ncbi:hypothetical protein VSDG_04930 [Cytospora chrysosperma]|uniref:Uncharacterized protein n=1 Tax=Cytospora chrysosperma TaxID=252740 RepID=A0A423W3P0_CYTCH|nr:hypothetical protein VSDG_04930 [Valsa sordida]
MNSFLPTPPSTHHFQIYRMAPSTTNKKAMKGSKPLAKLSRENAGLVTITVDPNRLAQLNLNSNNSNSSNLGTPTAATTMVGRSFVPDAATAGNSRAASADRTGDRVAMPTMAATHGAPTRQYLNSKVTAHVVEAMKIVAKEQPADPLRVLGEFLLQRSKELEETTDGADGEAAGDEANEADKNGDEQ